MPRARRARQRVNQGPLDRPERVDRNPPAPMPDENPPPIDEAAVQPDPPVPVAQPIQPIRPALQLTDDQLSSISDRVANQIMVQVGNRNPRDTVPIYDVNQAQGNFNLDEISDNAEFQIGSIEQELGCHVSNKMKMKIVSNEYIDLSNLLVKNVDPENVEKQLTIRDGNIILDTKKESSKIGNIQEWTDAFLVFASIYTTAFPSATAGLLKYIHTIRLGASRTTGLGWKNYDIQFRLKKEKNPALSWSVVDQELWLMYMYQFGQNKESQITASTVHPYLKCYDFNYKGVCFKKPCPYLHRCLKCSNPHPSVKCRVVSGNSRSGSYPGSKPRNGPATSTASSERSGYQTSRRS